MGADVVYLSHRAHHGLVYGLGRPKTEGPVDQGSGAVERHDESGGGDIGRSEDHQGVYCGGEDEQAV